MVYTYVLCLFVVCLQVPLTVCLTERSNCALDPTNCFESHLARELTTLFVLFTFQRQFQRLIISTLYGSFTGHTDLTELTKLEQIV